MLLGNISRNLKKIIETKKFLQKALASLISTHDKNQSKV